MSLALAELFVTITTKDGGFHKTLDGIKGRLDATKESLSGFASKAAIAFAAGAGAIAYFTHAAAEGDDAVNKLRFALEANGQEVDGNLEKFGELADHIKNITTYDDDAVRQGQALALNMGIQADQMEGVSKAAVGLAQLFGGDLQQGFHAASAAAQRNFRELRTLIPTLASLSDTEIQAKVGQLVAVGFKQAQRETQTFGGALKVLNNQIGDASKAIGAAFVPYLQKTTDFIRRLVDRFNALSPAVKENIGIVIGVATALAGLIAVLPFVLGGLSALVTVVGVLISPIGLVVAAVAALGLALVYAAGDGDTFGERVTSGFVKVLAAAISVTGAVISAWSQMSQAISAIMGGIVTGTIGALQFLAESLGATDIAASLKDANNDAKAFVGQWNAELGKAEKFGDKLNTTTASDINKFVDDVMSKLTLKPTLDKDRLKKDLEDLQFKPPPPNKKDKEGKDEHLDIFSAEEGFKRSIINRELAVKLEGAKRGDVGLDPKLEVAKEQLAEQKEGNKKFDKLADEWARLKARNNWGK